MLSAEEREKLAADVLPVAMRYAESRARGSDELAERTRDAATDAVMRALDLYDPSKGSFRGLAFALVRSRAHRAVCRRTSQEERRPGMSTFGEWEDDGFQAAAPDLPMAGEVPMTPELLDMPPDLRDTVRFYYIDGFNLDVIGLLMGVSKSTARNRLHQAAEALAADGVKQPAREKYLKRVARHERLSAR